MTRPTDGRTRRQCRLAAVRRGTTMKRQWVCVTCLAAAGVLAGARGARAVEVASDSFAYPSPGGLNGNAGGSGFGANVWAQVGAQPDPAIGSGSLQYSNGGRSIEASGNMVTPAAGGRSSRNLDAVEPVTGRVVWAGFRMNFTGTGAMPTNHAGISIFSGPNATGTEFFMGK